MTNMFKSALFAATAAVSLVAVPAMAASITSFSAEAAARVDPTHATMPPFGEGPNESALDSGMFDINFSNAQTASFYGPIVLTGTSLKAGVYDVFSGIAGGLPVGSGTITIQAVPEPGTWAILALGLAGLGARARKTAKAKAKAL